LERSALEYGPLLLAFVNETGGLGGGIEVNNLVPDASRPLYFSRKDSPSWYFMPYMLISNETFTVYPVNWMEDPDFVLENHISAPGFSVEFFDNERREGTPVYRGTVPSINYLNESKRPIAPKVPIEHFSSRFTGEFIAPKTGTITFILSTDDGYSFSVNGKLMSQSPKHTNRCPVFLLMDVVKGEKYTLKLEHTQGTGDYRIVLKIKN
jgi:hypothetical protein